ncbi:hypothetical protein ACI780_06885 [Geodermatophilus sp. SYSU D00814]
MDDELIGQLGLLLTQTRFARRALEDIERATSTYGTFAFTSVIAAGPRFGAPPLFDGALKVHVVNIGDLAPGGGFGDFLSGLLGGIGSFLGNLPGGLIGGTLSSYQLVRSLPTIDSITGRVERILARIGTGEPTEDEPAATSTGRGGPVGGSGLVAQLEQIRSAVNGLTGLFLAAGQGAGAAPAVLPATPEADRWQRLLDSLLPVLAAIGRVVDGLVIGLPLLVGSLASVITRLADIRLAIAETLRFALRVALLVRGAITVTAFDTLALVARMGVTVVQVLGSAVAGVVSSIFVTVREAALAVLELGAVLGDAAKTTVDRLLGWVVPTVDTVLRNLGDLRVFRVITHVVRILPAILPPIYELKTDRPMESTAVEALRAAAAPFLEPLTAGAAALPAPPSLPDFRAVLTDPAMVERATIAFNRVEQSAIEGLEMTTEAAQQGLRSLATRLDAAALAETRLSDATLGERMRAVAAQSEALAGQVVVPEVTPSRTGLEVIATAYEHWLQAGGLDSLLGSITRHFAGETGRAGVPRALVEGEMDRPRATVQIDEVVVEITPAAPAGGAAGEVAPAPVQVLEPPPVLVPDDMSQYRRMLFDDRLRGGRCWPREPF